MGNKENYSNNSSSKSRRMDKTAVRYHGKTRLKNYERKVKNENRVKKEIDILKVIKEME